MEDKRVAANPIPRDHNPTCVALTVIPDAQQHGLVLRESELVWLTLYVQGLNELAPPLPSRVAITGPRAAGLALDDPMKITVVVADHSQRLDLEPRLAETAAAASEAVPSVKPQIIVLSLSQWDGQQTGKTAPEHYNVWLAPLTAP